MKLSLAYALLLLGGCTAVADSPSPIERPVSLEVSGSFPVNYRAFLSRDGLPQSGSQTQGPRSVLEKALGDGLPEPGSQTQGTPLAEDPRDGAVEEVTPEGPMIDTAVKLIELDSEALDELLPRLASGDLGRILQPDQGAVLTEWLQAGHIECNLISSPRMLTRAGETGTISIIEQSAFIETFEVRFEDEAPEVMLADPVVGVASHGMTFSTTISPSTEGSLSVEMDLQIVEASDPFPRASLPLPGSENEVTIQLPCFTHQSIQAEVPARSGESILLGPLPSTGSDRSLLLLLTTHKL